ncbi:hypothetical protein N7281_04565 [Rickettsia hoogstraalii]|uniref:hypothetical protein n=1 Tax=Rickettsia hoogstraalii TaxID=467174 RepID=UPI002253C78C|nr:hypothetical protein [Rickettsia hoogstraalii]MCX4084121.1 hypothetical protein [Rickettsia hoogstraalii]
MLNQRIKIQHDVDDIAKKINKYLNDTTKAIHTHYDKKMKSVEIQKLPTELKKEHDVMLNITKKIGNAVTTHELLETMQIIHDSANSLGISIARNNIPIITNQKQYFNFLKVISDRELTTETLTWLCPFKDAVQYLDRSEKWYKFLNSLYSKFSEYEIQKDRSKYDVANLEDWGTAEKPQGIEINKNNFEAFLNKTAEYDIAEYDNIKHILITGSQLEELNHVLNLTLKHRINVNCIEPYMSIRGNYIIVKEVLREVSLRFLQQHWGGALPNNMVIDMDDSCDLTTLKYEKLKFINVFALNTLFINEDVSLRGNNTLTVIAPKWQVIGTRKISLDGVAGESHHNSTVQKHPGFTLNIIHGRSKAKDGAYPGANGADGQPGGAGGPGGNFFGIGKQFIDGANLTITVNGGIGGSGQDGGNGFKGRDFKGRDGSSPVVPSTDISCHNDLCDGSKQINGFDCEKIHYSYSGGRIGGFGAQTYSDPVRISCKYKIFGKPGGKGGDGGSGGNGGNPGNIVLFELNNSSGISKYNNTGKNGEHGKDGMGGNGGNYGDNIVVSYSNSWAANGWSLKERIYNNIKSPSGKNGIDGNNIQNIEYPKLATIIDELDQAKIINKYKSYLRENLNDRFTKSFLTKFLNILDNNQNVKNVYNTLGLVDELKGLEEQFHKLNKDIDLLPFYQSLLDRISEYAQNPKEVENSNQYKKVLSYLYTATLGRIYNLEDIFESDLIINIT